MNSQRICEGFDGGGRGSTLIKIFASVLHTLKVQILIFFQNAHPHLNISENFYSNSTLFPPHSIPLSGKHALWRSWRIRREFMRRREEEKKNAGVFSSLAPSSSSIIIIFTKKHHWIIQHNCQIRRIHLHRSQNIPPSFADPLTTIFSNSSLFPFTWWSSPWCNRQHNCEPHFSTSSGILALVVRSC